MIVAMVAVGGITRLTDSGLSMVEWKPILGVIPPTTEEGWQEAFDKYKVKAAAQYELLSQSTPMELSDFQRIYFWEYIHRLLGRVVGMAYAIPFFAFWALGFLNKREVVHLFAALIVGGLQGVMGWYMVTSGFADLPTVSHYRLAAHLSLALLLFSWLVWVILGIRSKDRNEEREAAPIKLRAFAFVALLLLSVQIVWGAFVAGLDAGSQYQEYPLMGGRVFPANGLQDRYQPVLANFVSNPAAVQFVHRHFAIIVVGVTIGVGVLDVRRRQKRDQTRLPVYALYAVAAAQFLLGVFTLILRLPISVAVAHQICACAYLCALLVLIHGMRPQQHVKPV